MYRALDRPIETAHPETTIPPNDIDLEGEIMVQAYAALLNPPHPYKAATRPPYKSYLSGKFTRNNTNRRHRAVRTYRAYSRATTTPVFTCKHMGLK